MVTVQQARVLGTNLPASRLEPLQRFGDRAWALMVWLLGALIVAGGLRSARAGGVSAEDLGGIARGAGAESGAAALAYKATLVVILIVAAACLARYLPVQRARPQGLRWFWLGMLLSGSALGLSIVFGSSGRGAPTMLELQVLVAAWWALPAPSLAAMVRDVRRVLLAILWGSVVFGVLAPDLAVTTYTGLVPGLDTRLHGLTSHANVLGALSGLYLLLEGAPGSSHRRMVLANRAIAVTALIWCQSKTSLLGLLVALAVVLLARPGPRPGSRTSAAVVLAVIGATGPWWTPYLTSSLTARQLADLENLTGRTRIWDVSLQVWHREELFGYGPSLWDLTMRLQYLNVLPNPPAHAHNQLVQDLASFGWIGLAALVLLTVGLIVAAAHARVATAGVSLGLVTLVAVRSLSEVAWFPASVAQSAPTALVFLVLIAGAGQGTRLSSRRAPETPSAPPSAACSGSPRVPGTSRSPRR